MENKTPKAKQITKENRFITLATSSKTGVPWISPVFYSFDDDYNLYWVSNKNSRHSQLIRENPCVAIVIYNSTKGEGEGDAVYIEASVVELSEEAEIEKAIQVYDQRASKEELRIKNPSNVLGSKVWRVYKAIPTKVYKSGPSKEVRGQHIDTTVEIKLDALRELL